MQEQTFQQTPAIYSQNLKTKGKTYFFDVKAAKNGNKYIKISENSMNKDGQKYHSTITVFQNDLQEFSKALSETLEQVK